MLIIEQKPLDEMYQDALQSFPDECCGFFFGSDIGDESELKLLGVYHSHPNHPAIPSEHDRVAAQPYFSYVIISVNETGIAEIRSWQMNDNLQFEEEKTENKFINQNK